MNEPTISRRELMRRAGLACGALALSGSGTRAVGQPRSDAGLGALEVSDDGRRLVRGDGAPFFWLGDTAWELFHRLSRQETHHYLKTRAEQGFTVVQAILLPEYGHDIPNAAGAVPFLSISDQQLEPNPAYFEHVDHVIAEAARLGLYVLALPSWRYHWKQMTTQSGFMSSPFLTPQNVAGYARFLGSRYRDWNSLIWGLGGDMLPEEQRELDLVQAAVNGLKAGGARELMTYHPGGNKSSSLVFHDAKWLDFNMCQSGHRLDNAVWDLIGADWNLSPAKPVIDGESLYEDIPRPLWMHTAETPHSTAYEVRRSAYAGVFAGGFGYTYGANSVFQFYAEGGPKDYYPTVDWRKGLQFPGAWQMMHLRRLMQSRPQERRVPDQALIAVDNQGRSGHVAALRDQDGGYAMAYSPFGRPFTVRLERLRGTTLVSHWYDPQTGEAIRGEEFPRFRDRVFTPPDGEGEQDWVLVIDDAARGYDAPGAV